MQQYSVRRIPNQTKENRGSLQDLWEHAVVMKHFLSPWVNLGESPTSFRALYDDHHLYFRFEVTDSHVYVNHDLPGRHAIDNSDRVELFFRTDEELNPYYCLEIDSEARCQDFKGHPGKKLDFDWNWPTQELLLTSKRTELGFEVEGALKLSTFEELGLLNDGKIETGVYRARYHRQPDNSWEPEWICWVDPKTPEPDFHNPHSFGVFELEGYSESGE